jgi:hypothetical protein
MRKKGAKTLFAPEAVVPGDNTVNINALSGASPPSAPPSSSGNGGLVWEKTMEEASVV